MSKKGFYSHFIIAATLFLLFLPSDSFAAYPKLISTITTAFETIETWIIRISTPAAAVAVRNWYIYEKIQFW